LSNKLACSPCWSTTGRTQKPRVRILLKLRKSFFGLNSQLLNCDYILRWSHLHFICISAVDII